MCGRYTLRTKLNLLLSQFAAEMAESLDVVPRYNIAPTQQVLAIRHPRELFACRWGLVPSWSKDTKLAPVNARSDSVATKPLFRSAFKRRRCLILADGYYEWLTEGKSKHPLLYEIDGGKPFAFAGLWENAQHAASEPLESCTIITTDANELAREIHDRMPVILNPEDYDAWLDPALDDRQTLEGLLAPLSADRMTARPVNTFVNSARHEGPECIEPPG
jgi:putative SOS response-associated peptidase YedK